MQILSWPEFREAMVQINNQHLPKRVGYIVFTADSFDRLYSERSRTYRVDSDAKEFNTRMIGRSLYGSCLDGSDQCVELVGYISGGWRVEYCILLDPGEQEWPIG